MPGCCVFGCHNRDTQGKKFFAIPRRKENAGRRKVWLHRIGRVNFEPRSARLCDDHFEKSEFESLVLNKFRVKKLKKNATPSIFCHRKQLQPRKPSTQQLQAPNEPEHPSVPPSGTQLLFAASNIGGPKADFNSIPSNPLEEPLSQAPASAVNAHELHENLHTSANLSCGFLFAETVAALLSLNQNCGTRFGNGSLNNATEPLSSAIVTATQFRDRRAATTDGCSTEIGASSSESMIVSLVEMNLRQGLLNDSCIDYVNIITRFTSANDPDQQCGRIRESEHKAFSTSYTLSIKLFSRTPLSYFSDGNILAVVVTAANEREFITFSLIAVVHSSRAVYAS
ncbi:hypothetical protein MRX96_028008 [Rhipicephalus microplus]